MKKITKIIIIAIVVFIVLAVIIGVAVGLTLKATANSWTKDISGLIPTGGGSGSIPIDYYKRNNLTTACNTPNQICQSSSFSQAEYDTCMKGKGCQ